MTSVSEERHIPRPARPNLRLMRTASFSKIERSSAMPFWLFTLLSQRSPYRAVSSDLISSSMVLLQLPMTCGPAAPIGGSVPLRFPVRDEQVGFVRLLAVPIGCPDELLPIRTERREAVKLVTVRDALQTTPIEADLVDLELSALRIGPVRGEHEALAIRRPARREACDVLAAVVRDAATVRSIGVHNIEVQRRGPDEVLFQERLVVGDLLRRLRMVSAIADLRAVRRPPGAAI